MIRFGTALIARHSKRLVQAGFDHVEIGQARFDTLGRRHCAYGTAMPGRFFWHGENIEFDLDSVNRKTGLFHDAGWMVRFIDHASNRGGR
jgi:hypothetical protein